LHLIKLYLPELVVLVTIPLPPQLLFLFIHPVQDTSRPALGSVGKKSCSLNCIAKQPGCMWVM